MPALSVWTVHARPLQAPRRCVNSSNVPDGCVIDALPPTVQALVSIGGRLIPDF